MNDPIIGEQQFYMIAKACAFRLDQCADFLSEHGATVCGTDRIRLTKKAIQAIDQRAGVIARLRHRLAVATDRNNRNNRNKEPQHVAEA